MKTSLAILLLTLFLSITAAANDSTATTAAGGIQFTKTADIKMVSEHLRVSLQRIKVDYVFKNMSDKPVTTAIVFPLPEFKDADVMGMQVIWDDEVANASAAPLGNFKVIVNGQTVPHKTMIRALLDGKDITRTLKQAGIPLNTVLASKNGIGQLDVDENGHVIGIYSEKKFRVWKQKAKRLGLMDSDDNPLWTKQILYYWIQTFPAHQDIAISHEYVPTNGWNDVSEWKTSDCKTDLLQFVSDDDWKPTATSLAEDVCLKDADDQYRIFTNWPEYYALSGGSPFAKHVRYILTTGANWAGPIEKFTLNIDYPRQNAVVLYSQFYKNEPAQIIKRPGNIQIRLNNFVPQEDLSVLVYEPH